MKIIFTKNIVVRHVTIVTCGITGMRTVLPGSVIRTHDMAIYARARIIRGITPCARSVHGKNTQTTNNAQRNNGKNFPTECRQQSVNKIFKPNNYIFEEYVKPLLSSKYRKFSLIKSTKKICFKA